MGKMKTSYISAILFCLLFSILSVNAQITPDSSDLLILPFDANGIDPVYVSTAESILNVELTKSGRSIVPRDRTHEILDSSECYTAECALMIGKKAGVSEVTGCRLAALGEKIIVQYFLVEISSGKTLIMDQLAAENLEDLEPVMKRIASNIIEKRSSDKNAMVGNIVKQETNEPLRRSSRKNIGVSFGYLFPQYGYNNDDRSFTINLHLDYELEDFATGLLAGARDGFAMNIYGEYLFSRTDFCPFAGASFGFHWVSHSSVETYDYVTHTYSDKKKGDGFELGLKTGMRVLHTYNFQILFNLEYILTFNDFNDKAIVFTIGIL